MSSLIQWPTIYGSVYFLPGIIVVVLLLLLLLLMSSRRRSKAERAKLAPEPVLASEGPEPVEEEQMAPALEPAAHASYSPGVMTQPVAMVQPGGVVTQHVGLYAQPVAQPAVMAAQSSMAAPQMATQPSVAPSLTLVPPPTAAAPAMMAAPVTAAAVTMAPIATATVLEELPEPDPMFEPVKSGRRAKVKAARSTASLFVVGSVNTPSGTDPLSAAIQEILNGWGDLTPEDMKRLELFRPDRLSAALAAVQLSKSKSGDAKVRLIQMRQYGVDLERRAQATQAAEAAVAGATVAAATMPAGAMHTGGTPAGAPGQAAEEQPPLEQRSSIFTGSTNPASEQPAARGFYDAEPAKPFLWPQEETPAAQAPAVVEPEVTPPAAIADPDALWAEPRPLWEPDPEPAFEELPAPVFDEIEMGPAAKQGVPLDTSALTAALNTPMGMPIRETQASAVDPLEEAFAAASLQPETPQPVTPAHSKSPFDDELFWDDEPGTMSHLSLKVETAEQLMALPPTEQVDMTAFLPPTELAATFRATHDLELKKAVIDTLEHIGTPASLNALGNCFEDADADIQVYALAAADRLLGVA